MLISLAWKNIWRKKKRSLIIVAAITFGLWGGLFSGAVMMGGMESMVETAISRSIAHIQIHKLLNPFLILFRANRTALLLCTIP